MKKYIIIIISALLLAVIIALVLLLSFGCRKPKTIEEAHEILYEWLIDNGKLEGGSKLSYSSGSFILTADSSKNITVYYSKGRFDGFSTAYELPLFPFEETTEMKMTLTVPAHSYRQFVFDVSFSPSSFKNNVPLSYDLVSKPGYEKIVMNDYGTTYYQDGKAYFKLDPDKADEYYALKKHNEEIDNQTKKAEKSATETSHAIIADILSWLESDICKSAGLTLSELGYKEYNK